MSDAEREVPEGVRHDGAGTIRRRHVIYVSGFDPRGAQGFFDLFRRSCERFQRLWPVVATLDPPKIDSEQWAHWHLVARGPTWQVATFYEFVRMESAIQADIERPLLRQVARALGWCADDVLSGAEFSIFRASWRFALHLLYFQLLAIVWIAVAIAAGVVGGYTATRYLDLAPPASISAAIAVSLAVLFALRPLARRCGLFQISACWATLRRFGRGQSTWIDHVVEVGARRLVEAMRKNAADEIVLVGHSTGGIIASAIADRALALDSDLGGSGPSLVLLTLGSVMPAVALHPAAHRMRSIVSRLAITRNLAWIDCQSRKDVMCFANFDPVDGVGVRAGARRCNPLLWLIRFKDMIAAETYNRFRWDFFRVHYQYIMAGDRPAPYDYVLLVSGPMPIVEWPNRDREFMMTLLQDAAPAGQRRGRDAVIGA